MGETLRKTNSVGDAFTFSPDGKTMVAWDSRYGRIVVNGADRIVKLIDVATWREFATLESHLDSASFSPDNKTLITWDGSNGIV